MTYMWRYDFDSMEFHSSQVHTSCVAMRSDEWKSSDDCILFRSVRIPQHLLLHIAKLPAVLLGNQTAMGCCIVMWRLPGPATSMPHVVSYCYVVTAGHTLLTSPTPSNLLYRPLLPAQLLQLNLISLTVQASRLCLFDVPPVTFPDLICPSAVEVQNIKFADTYAHVAFLHFFLKDFFLRNPLGTVPTYEHHPSETVVLVDFLFDQKLYPMSEVVRFCSVLIRPYSW